MKHDPSSPKPPLKLRVGDVLELKKPHACGANEWEVVKLGMDIRLRCKRCGRVVMLLRSRLERRIRRFLERPSEPSPEPQSDRGPGASSQGQSSAIWKSQFNQ